MRGRIANALNGPSPSQKTAYSDASVIFNCVRFSDKRECSNLDKADANPYCPENLPKPTFAV